MKEEATQQFAKLERSWTDLALGTLIFTPAVGKAKKQPGFHPESPGIGTPSISEVSVEEGLETGICWK